MRAFHNDPKVKEFYLNRVIAHRKADEIIKGKYWEYGKGCAVGCTLHSDQHVSYEAVLGIPIRLAYLEDHIFENLPNDLAQSWPERFLQAMPVGKDLSRVWPEFAIFLLTDQSQCASRHHQCDIIAQKLKYFLTGKKVDFAHAADAARAAAYVAAAGTGAYAADAYAADAARAVDFNRAVDAAHAARAAAATAYEASAAYDRAVACASAAYAAYAAASDIHGMAVEVVHSSANASEARTTAYIKQSEKLLELLSYEN